MRKRWILAGVIFLLLSWLLVGCGVAQEQYDTVVADLSKAQQELQTTRTELESVKSEISTTKSELESVKTSLTGSQSKVSELTSSLEKSKVDLETKQAELGRVKEELNEIKKVYPPRGFSSLKELQDWLRTNDVSERPASTNAEPMYSKALQIQEDALKDGYIISAGIVDLEQGQFLITLVAVIGGDVFMWNPETDEVTDFSGLTGLLKVQ